MEAQGILASAGERTAPFGELTRRCADALTRRQRTDTAARPIRSCRLSRRR